MQRLTLTILACLALAGCGGDAEAEVTEPQPSGPASGYTELDDYRGELIESSITLADGRKVTCVVADISRGGGVSCDWVGADERTRTEEELRD